MTTLIKHKQIISMLVLAATLFSLCGCASIVSKSSWPVTVQSLPDGARCNISKPGGVKLHTGEAPMTVTLDSSAGFFRPASYLINCQGNGTTATTSISAGLNGWYFGNIIFGGLIGLLIVDPATGAMWQLEETAVVDLTGPDRETERVSFTPADSQ